MATTDTDTRKGLNATLSYKDGNGTRQVFNFRCSVITWGIREIMDESQSSKTRTMYPRKTAPAQFMVTAECKNYDEFVAMRDWLRGYAIYATDTSLADTGTGRMMTVSCPNRKFTRKGVLKTGITYGNHIGAMVWQPVLVFEALVDPLATPDGLKAAYVQYGDSATRHANPDLESRYFYPFGTQLSGDAKGNDFTPVKDPAASAPIDGDSDSTTDDPTTMTTNTTGTTPPPVTTDPSSTATTTVSTSATTQSGRTPSPPAVSKGTRSGR